MNLTEFVENLIVEKFGDIPSGHLRMHPSVHPEMDLKIGEMRQMGIVKGVRFYADPGVPEGQVRFIAAEGRITILLPVALEEKEVEQKAPAKKPGKKKVPRKRKARSIRTRSPKTDRV